MELTPDSHHVPHETYGTPEVETSRRTSSRRAPRIRTACVRCQKRKIKCDGRSPSCSSCSKAGVTCVDGGKQQDRYPRAYIASLQNRIQWLESLLNKNCPEIDLNEGPRITQEGVTQDGDPAFAAENVFPTPGLAPLERVDDIDPAMTNGIQQILDDSQPDRLAHEIGLVSVTAGQDPRYVGPSSGYSFAKLITASIGRNANHRQRIQSTSISTSLFHVTPSTLPTSLDYACQLSAAYWENIHCQYLFLHKPTHLKLMEHVYNASEPSPIALFQVYMVLAISSTILSRRLKLPIPAEGYCATAMTYFDRIQIEGSLEGLQCLLLLQMYGMNNPSMGLNLWYLNYQCIANVLDLGLQRDVRAGKNLSFLTQEMRTRIFWVVYSIDRTLATIMGRPIGLRDEACDLRMPADVDDDSLLSSPITNPPSTTPTTTTMPLHLITLSQLNSEIKYIANSISHKTPPHSYPQIPSISTWQQSVLTRLNTWLSTIPPILPPSQQKLLQIKYHELTLLLLRPSPLIRSPTPSSLQLCHTSSISLIRGFEELYRADLLLYNWPTVHSVFLACVSMLYCIWSVPSIAKEVKVETLSADLNSASKVLCALAEHWVDAKRGRDVLDELSSVTIRWIVEGRKSGIGNDERPVMESLLDTTLSSEPWKDVFGLGDGTGSSLDFELDSLMQGIFSDYTLDLDFGQSLPFDASIADSSMV